jgi:hypothetical protein
MLFNDDIVSETNQTVIIALFLTALMETLKDKGKLKLLSYFIFKEMDQTKYTPDLLEGFGDTKSHRRRKVNIRH